MENRVSFPPGCEVVGQVNVFESGPFREDVFYVRGHPEKEDVRWVGGRPADTVDGKTGVETPVRVLQGPSDYFHG